MNKQVCLVDSALMIDLIMLFFLKTVHEHEL